jgi:hypothetical protein
MYTPGPAISLRTSRCGPPQNEHDRSICGAPASLAARTVSRKENLLQLLSAETKHGSDVPPRRTARDQPVHTTMELSAGNRGIAFSIDQPPLGPPGLSQQLLIHPAHCSQMLSDTR